MRVLSWNCQGLGSRLTGKHLRRLQRKHDPSLLFLMETCQCDEVLIKWQTDLKFTNSYLVPPSSDGGSGGGLALFWKDDLQLSGLRSSPNFIDCSVSFVNERGFPL